MPVTDASPSADGMGPRLAPNRPLPVRTVERRGTSDVIDRDRAYDQPRCTGIPHPMWPIEVLHQGEAPAVITNKLSNIGTQDSRPTTTTHTHCSRSPPAAKAYLYSACYSGKAKTRFQDNQAKPSPQDSKTRLLDKGNLCRFPSTIREFTQARYTRGLPGATLCGFACDVP